MLHLLALLSPASACEQAEHYRLFPLGIDSSGLIALEINQMRRSDSPLGKPQWHATPRLVRVTDSGTITLREYAPMSLPKPEGLPYTEGLRAVLSGAANARQLSGFQPLTPVGHTRCGYQGGCGEQAVLTDAGSLADPSRWENVGDGPHTSESVVGLPIGEHRTWELGEQRYRVVTVGTGSHLPSPVTVTVPGTEALSEQAFAASIPHHGAVFDVLIAL